MTQKSPPVETHASRALFQREGFSNVFSHVQIRGSSKTLPFVRDVIAHLEHSPSLLETGRIQSQTRSSTRNGQDTRSDTGCHPPALQEDRIRLRPSCASGSTESAHADAHIRHRPLLISLNSMAKKPPSPTLTVTT